ncbi:DUF4105 domain-containing protein [Arcicella sp. LKC2W]|uniref:lipoprotein N-acyltransferase Lnb domain-containing protein n=1 Tax=Arcicella sp. LKC2W TaxID=2984198 RepID=UPI002B201DC9|nr:DUF4105 domain-containing protein [Arcicella sp. LKC2W]MEA5459819.1 DUF4105 domain-containing protein [Arcicella sp. LKC2W]
MKYLKFIPKILSLSILMLVLALQSVAQKLSESTKISLITVAPGDELNDAFGHTLLWIYDPSNGIDKAYNFGGYDYDTENFYFKFIRGQLPYQMSYAPLYAYQEYYQKHNRNMTEQVMSLGIGQKQLIFDSLEKTYNNPSTRNYMYKFFSDNCSTRIRDALMLACTDSVHLQNITAMNDSSYRQWMNKCLLRKHHYWAAVGMNAALGAPADKRILQFDACYLPENLMKSMAAARRMSKHHVYYFVRNTHDLFPTNPVDEEPSFFLTPRFWFSLILLITAYITFNDWKKRNKGYLYDKILFGIIGIFGWLLLFLWFGTDHGVTNYNKNLLWAFPLHLPIIFLLSEKKDARDFWYGYYFIVVGLMIAMGLFFVFQYSMDTVPLVLALFVRAFYHAGFEREHRMTKAKFRKIVKGRKLEVIHYEHENGIE